jgi:hypothetical protein
MEERTLPQSRVAFYLWYLGGAFEVIECPDEYDPEMWAAVMRVRIRKLHNYITRAVQIERDNV